MVQRWHNVACIQAGCTCAPAAAASDDEWLRGSASRASWHAAPARAHAPAAAGVLPAAGHARLRAPAGLRPASLGAAARADAHAAVLPWSAPWPHRLSPKSLLHASFAPYRLCHSRVEDKLISCRKNPDATAS